MPDRTKIATCCYCGSRTMLSLRGRVQHHLACSACGAPLSTMKALRLDPDPAPRRPHRAPMAAERPRPSPPSPSPLPRRGKRRKPFGKRALDRIEDLFEDILDIFD